MAKQTACYVRVSTTDQKKGLASQKKALKDYADNHGLSNVVWYEDKVSGGSLDRPAFAKLQKAVFNGEIETILVWKLDRVSRSLKDGIVTLTDWVERGVRVISVTQLIDMHGPTGRLIATVLFAVSEMEREGIRENTRRGLMAAKARGVKVIIAGAGKAAHLAGVLASLTTLPIIGVPMKTSDLGGLDSLLSTVQMPGGIPVATTAIGTAGAKNAALLAIAILALSDATLDERLTAYREQMTRDVEQADADVQAGKTAE